MTTMMDAALSYLRRGWSVIPLGPDKRPALKTWKPYQSRFPTMEEVQEWWGGPRPKNIGIVCGEVSNLLVMDIDSEEGQQFADEMGIPDTLTVTTGKGQHLYFTYPTAHDWTNRASAKPGIDVRGEGGYVVAPPTIHPDTKKPYVWVDETMDPVKPPQWFLNLYPEPENPGLRVVRDSTNESEVVIPAGERNDTLFRRAARLVRQGKTQAEVLADALAYNEFCEPQLPEREIARSVKSAFDIHERNNPKELSPDDRRVVLRDVNRKLGLDILRIDKYVKDKPTWEIWIESRVEPIKVETVNQLISQVQFNALMFSVANVMPNPVPKNEWPKVVQQMGMLIQEIEVGEEGFDRGQTEMWLESFLEGDVYDEAGLADAAQSGAPFKKDGVLYFSFSAFRNFVQKDLGNKVTEPEMSTRLKQIGCSATKMMVPVAGGGMRQRRFWKAPGLRLVEDGEA